jgi:hypothetical protein
MNDLHVVCVTGAVGRAPIDELAARGPAADAGQRATRFVFTLTGKAPRRV